MLRKILMSKGYPIHDSRFIRIGTRIVDPTQRLQNSRTFLVGFCEECPQSRVETEPSQKTKARCLSTIVSLIVRDRGSQSTQQPAGPVVTESVASKNCSASNIRVRSIVTTQPANPMSKELSHSNHEKRADCATDKDTS
jgi:hypothetical protein